MNQNTKNFISRLKFNSEVVILYSIITGVLVITYKLKDSQKDLRKLALALLILKSFEVFSFIFYMLQNRLPISLLIFILKVGELTFISIIYKKKRKYLEYYILSEFIVYILLYFFARSLLNKKD